MPGGRGEDLADRGSPPTTSDGNRAELVADLRVGAGLARHDAVAALVEAASCGPIHDYAEVFADAHTRARAMEVAVEHPVEGDDPRARHPVKLSTRRGRSGGRPRCSAAHGGDLREAGFDAAEFERLVTEVRFDRRGPPRG